MLVVRQSTARTVTVGPVLDADGVAVTTSVVGDFKIAKNGGAPAALNGSATLTHRNTGHYSLALTASDLDTVGQAEVVIDATTNACPLTRLTVVEEAVYDALFAASAAGYQVPIWAAANSTVNLSGTTIKTATDVETDTADIQTRLPAALVSGKIDANISYIGGAALSTSTAQLGVNVVNFGGSAGTFASGIPAVNATQISGDSTAADNLENAYDDTAGPVPWAGILDQGTAQSATSTTVVLRSASGWADDALNGAVIMVYGSTQGYWQVREITDYVLSTDTVTVDAWTTTPSGTITYKIFAGPPALSTLPAVNVTQVDGVSLATHASGYLPSDLRQISGSAVSTSTAQLGVNVVNFGGSAGTFSSGRPEVNVSHIGGSATPVTNMTTVYSTDFASNYSTTDDAWAVKLKDSVTHGGSTAVGIFNLFRISGDDVATATGRITVTGGGVIADSLGATAKAEVNTEVDTALADINLDHLVKSAVDTNFATTVHLDSVIGHLADAGTTATFDRTTDSLEVLGAATAPSAASIADAVWDEALSGHLAGGSTGEALNAAGSAGDPWVTALPGAYSAGSAGYIVGTNLNATVSSRASQTSVDTIDTNVDSILADTGTDGVVVAAGSKSGYTISGTITTLDALDTAQDSQHATTRVDTAAIKAKTDQLTFGVTNQVNANVESINATTVNGTGTSGDKWRGA